MRAENFGRRLKELLDERGISLRQFSSETGIDKATVSRIINGKRKVNIGHINTFAGHLGISINELLDAAGYSVNAEDQADTSDVSLSAAEIYQTLTETNFYNNDFSVDEVRKQLKQYEHCAKTEEGRETILGKFEKKVEKVSGAGPFIEHLKEFYTQFTEGKAANYKLGIMGSALLYFIIPVDVIPDYVFPMGYIDDALAVKIAVKMLSS